MAVTGTETYTTVYTYDANNRLLTEAKTENSETVTTTYTYDPNGNTLTKSTPAHGEDEASSTTYTYNGFNQLSALTVDGTSVAYAYNAQGIRTAKRVNNTRTAFLLDGGNVVAEVQNNTVTDNYLRGVNLIRRTSSSETEYYLFNAHGDVVTTTNLNGTVNQEYDYDAFGNEKNPDALDTNPFRYCGEYLDFETGCYYLRARIYIKPAGRFLTEDPAHDGINWYVYCNNNPLYFIDPTGQIVEIMHYKNPDRAYGHIDIAINGVVYSFAPYDSDSNQAHGTYGNGVIMVADKEAYISYRKENGDVITGFQLNFTQEQEDELLSILEEYISGAEVLDKESDFAQYYYGKAENGLDTYTALIVPFVGVNCIGFVDTALKDANSPRDLSAPIAVDLPHSVYNSLNYSYYKYQLYFMLSTKMGGSYKYPNGCVINKTIY